MKRTWTKIAAKDFTDGNHPKYEHLFNKLKWEKWEIGKSLPFVPRTAIKIAVKELKIPRVTHYAISRDMVPYNLYGIRGLFSNGIVKAYILDTGDSAVVLATDFYPKDETDNLDETTTGSILKKMMKAESKELKLMNVVMNYE
jgi:hypothetical protein